MNNARRKQIEKLIDAIENIEDELSSIYDDEQYYFDNIPENLQDSENATRSQDCLDLMDQANDNISELKDNLESVIYQ